MWWTDDIDAGDITRGDTERVPTVRALVDAIRKKVEFTLAEDQIVNESIVLGKVDSYNM